LEIAVLSNFEGATLNIGGGLKQGENGLELLNFCRLKI
jgi:hypothetical protein